MPVHICFHCHDAINPYWPHFTCGSCGISVCSDCEGLYTANETSQLCIDCDDEAATQYYGSESNEEDNTDMLIVPARPVGIVVPVAEPPEATVVLPVRCD